MKSSKISIYELDGNSCLLMKIRPDFHNLARSDRENQFEGAVGETLRGFESHLQNDNSLTNMSN
jgi:hypothetical protein